MMLMMITRLTLIIDYDVDYYDHVDYDVDDDNQVDPVALERRMSIASGSHSRKSSTRR